jgi:pyridoxine 5-phosphate synthase
MPAPQPAQRLYINIDHVATLRQARRGVEPDPTLAAERALAAGADGITAHLREDRRHLQDHDLPPLRALPAPFNLEIACTPEMLAIAVALAPLQVTLVPERREEVTTEGGLDVARHAAAIRDACALLADAGIRNALFVDPDPAAIDQARAAGTDAVELHTGTYAAAPEHPAGIAALRSAAAHAAQLGLAVHAGHGLNLANVGLVAAIPEVEELNIGHSIVSQSVFLGIEGAVRAMREAMRLARPR